MNVSTNMCVAYLTDPLHRKPTYVLHVHNTMGDASTNKDFQKAWLKHSKLTSKGILNFDITLVEDHLLHIKPFDTVLVNKKSLTKRK